MFFIHNATHPQTPSRLKILMGDDNQTGKAKNDYNNKQISLNLLKITMRRHSKKLLNKYFKKMDFN